MPVSARGVWTPADSDDWDLTVDLAAMATSIDVAMDNAVAQAIAGATLVDTGWVDLSTAYDSGVTGSLFGRRMGNSVFLRGIPSITISSGSTFTTLSSAGVPAQFRPTSGNIWGTLWNAGYIGGAQIQTSGTLVAANRTGANFTGNSQFSMAYAG